MNDFRPLPLHGKGTRVPQFGIALGGGGVRGLAHIGVLKVFEQNGLVPDCLAGASMGGLIAALYAAGLAPAQLEAEVERLTTRGSLYAY
jgi:NTE family protein